MPDTNDDDPPGLDGSPEVSPKVGTKDTTFRITIVADEPLGRPPTVVASGGRSALADGEGEADVAAIALPPFHLLSAVEGDGGDRRTFRYEYTAAGNEPEGVAVIGVELVDESGQVAQLTTDSFALDFVAPEVIESALLAGALAREGTLVSVSLTFSELLAGDVEPNVFFPEVFPETEPLVLLPRSPPMDEQTELFDYVVTGNEVEGPRPVHVFLVDRAGNDNFVEEGGGGGAVELPLSVTFDFTPPQPGNSGIDTTPHGANELITTSIDFDEVLADTVFVGGDVGFEGAPLVRAFLRGGDPAIDFVVLDVTHARATDDFSDEYTRLILHHRVRACDLEGIYDIVLDNVIDLAGNEADDVRGPWQFELADVVCE